MGTVRGTLGAWLATLLLAASLAGCSSVGFVPRAKDMSPQSRQTPTLSWNPVPTPEYESLRNRITDVSYELRIWTTYSPARRELARLTLVYTRLGLPGHVHEVEDPLRVEADFVWAVRARFKLDGEWRVSPWSTAAAWDRTAKLPELGYARYCTRLH